MIGIDISDESLKVVRLSNTEPRRLLSHCWQAVPMGIIKAGRVQQPEAMAKVIRAALKECGIRFNVNDPVVASISEVNSFLRVIDIPDMKADEVSEAIKWEVARHIPFGVENVYIDWQWVKEARRGNDGKMEVLVGASEKQVVDGLLKILKSLDLDVAALELESQALVRSLISPELKEKEGLLLVDIGGNTTNVVIHDRGTVRFTASLKKGVEDLIKVLTEEQRQGIHKLPSKDIENKESMADKVAPALDELVAEIYGIVEFYRSRGDTHSVNEILLTGGGTKLPGIEASFLRYFNNVHTQRGNPWVNLVRSEEDKSIPLSAQEITHYATALGLALRPVLL